MREFSGFSLAEILARSELMENLKTRQVANIKLGNTHKIDYSKDFLYIAKYLQHNPLRNY